MKITRNDVQERFTICVPYAWLDNHIDTPNLIRLGGNMGVYGVNYALYLFISGWNRYHIITGYRPDRQAADLCLSNTDLELIAKNLDNAKVIFGGGTPDFYKYCDRVLKGMFKAVMCDESPEKFLLECGVIKAGVNND